MRVGTLRLIALATAVAGPVALWGASIAVAEAPPYPPATPYPAPHRYPPPSPYPPPYPAPGLPPGLPKDFPRDPLGNLFPLPIPIPIPDAETQALLREGADKLMRAIERMIQTMPVYDPPVVTPEGDIILRRRPAPTPPVPTPPVVRRAPPPQSPAPSPWPSFPPPPGSTLPMPPIDRTTI